MAPPNWTHLVRFISEEDGQVHIGQVDAKEFPDVGLSIFNGEPVSCKVIKGSAFDGVVSNTTMRVARVCYCALPFILRRLAHV